MRDGLNEQTLKACEERIKAVEVALHDENKEFHINDHIKVRSKQFLVNQAISFLFSFWTRTNILKPIAFFFFFLS